MEHALIVVEMTRELRIVAWVGPGSMLRRYGASARSARARRTYDRTMEASP